MFFIIIITWYISKINNLKRYPLHYENKSDKEEKINKINKNLDNVDLNLFILYLKNIISKKKPEEENSNYKEEEGVHEKDEQDKDCKDINLIYKNENYNKERKNK